MRRGWVVVFGAAAMAGCGSNAGDRAAPAATVAVTPAAASTLVVATAAPAPTDTSSVTDSSVVTETAPVSAGESTAPSVASTVAPEPADTPPEFSWAVPYRERYEVAAEPAFEDLDAVYRLVRDLDHGAAGGNAELTAACAAATASTQVLSDEVIGGSMQSEARLAEALAVMYGALGTTATLVSGCSANGQLDAEQYTTAAGSVYEANLVLMHELGYSD